MVTTGYKEEESSRIDLTAIGKWGMIIYANSYSEDKCHREELFFFFFSFLDITF